MQSVFREPSCMTVPPQTEICDWDFELPNAFLPTFLWLGVLQLPIQSSKSFSFSAQALFSKVCNWTKDSEDYLIPLSWQGYGNITLGICVALTFPKGHF